MATSPRDVSLTIGVGVSGTSEVTDLAKAVSGIGTAGAASASDIAKYTEALEAAATAVKENREAESAAKTAVDAQKAAITDQRDALARLRLTTDDAAKGEQAFKDSIKAAQLALLDSRAALREKQSALDAASTSSRTAAAAEQQVREQLAGATAAYRAQQVAAAGAAQAQVTGAKTSAAALEEMGSALRSISTLAQTVLGGQLLAGTIGQVATTADSFKNLEARIKLASGEGDAFKAAMTGVQDISQRTGASLETTAALFTKLSAATKILGLKTSDAITLTETISQAIALSGESAQSSQAALVQFAQGLQAGVLRGEDLNSVLEQAPRLAKALADGLGVTTGQLKQLGEAGALTSTQVIGALQGQSAALQAEFSQLPATIGRSITNLSSAWTVFIGETDKATGASTTAAAAIDLLAKNLSTVAEVLFSVGKAAAAYQALRLAESFLGIGSAAKVASVEIAALNATQTATTAATAEAAAGVSRFASLLGGLKLFSLVGIVTNFREIGTAIGEGVAKLAGYDKPLKDLEIATKADAEAARLAAAERAAHAQALQLASDKALGLTDASRLLVAEFDKARKSGDSVTESLVKVAKAMDLSDLAGITAAGAALDALGVKGKASADQIKAAFADGLKGIDLGVFATSAAAAFDQSEQGVRRLKAALDAVADESLKRAGTSVEELKTGFSAAMTSAINDTDKLAETLKRLGVTAEQSSALLAKSLDKALELAKTKEGVQAVIDRFEALGKQGVVTGDQLTDGLQKAKNKLDEIKPGIDSLAEAMHAFGLKSREELTATADKLGTAYQKIATNTTVSLADQRIAFDQWSKAAIAANGGVESSAVKVARAILEIREDAAGAGKGITDAMNAAGTSVDNLTVKVNKLGERLNQTAGSLSGVSDPPASDPFSAAGIAARNKSNLSNLTSSIGGLPNSTGQLTIPSGSYFDKAAFDRDNNLALIQGKQVNPANYIRPIGPSVTINPDGSISGGVNINPGANRTPSPSPSPAPSPSPTPSPAPAPLATPLTIPGPAIGTTHNVSITLGGKTTTVSTTSAAQSETLVSVFAQLEAAMRAAGK